MEVDEVVGAKVVQVGGIGVVGVSKADTKPKTSLNDSKVSSSSSDEDLI